MAVGYLQLWKLHGGLETYLGIDAYLESTQPLHVSCKPPARNDQSAVVLAMKAPNHNLARDANF